MHRFLCRRKAFAVEVASNGVDIGGCGRKMRWVAVDVRKNFIL